MATKKKNIEEFTNQDIKIAIEEIVGHEVDVNTEVVDYTTNTIDANKIEFNKVLTKCKEVISKKKTKDSFYKWLDKNVEVDTYITFDVKCGWLNIFNEIIIQIKDSPIELAAQTEMFNTLFVLFTYTNIDYSLTYINSENYDIVKQSGLYNYIYDKVFEDYETWVKMSHNMVVYSNVSALNYVQNVDFNTDLNQMSKDTVEAFNSLDVNKLNNVMEIMSDNDPALNKIKDTIYDSSVELIQQSQEK